MKNVLNKKMRAIVHSILLHVLVVVAAVFMLAPVIWLLSTSLKDRSEMFTFPLTLIPKHFVWENYLKIWQQIPFGEYVKNSVIMALYSTFVALAISSLAAYAFSRFNFKRKTVFMRLILFTQMFPAVLLIIPLFIYLKNLGLLGSYTGLMITFLTFLVPFSTWSLTNFFEGIPLDLDEAALIDGCSRLDILYRILLPISLPGLVSVGTYCFLTAWNEFIFSMVFMPDQQGWTIPVGLNALTGQFALDWGLLTAGGIICLIPAIIVVLFLQRYLIAGMLAGAVKE
ncbi:carbohydrate ABC transporter membrane protein 2 (CUT1 family) [Hydrogenispora ethanolica]|uniref:Carbohydrate ABC transporter membrane protein 2 (CUT1 family) n=1 Tax=Hydrogenispora ethanolica TaxID=1082276 RepID=A0A4R1SB52_HYDET|nr:carbohydrate ABC transporter permease [Hydrogenispora ethanolica]TCL76474.1 carbohydrate ABC transporter membrane protein 2 (CUT1 family) [Hydrogenispora ethanolica]